MGNIWGIVWYIQNFLRNFLVDFAREILLELTSAIVRSFNLWGGKPFEDFLSDHRSEFWVSRSSLSHIPRDSSPGRCPAGQAASWSQLAHEKVSRFSKAIAVLPATSQFLHIDSHSGKAPHATYSALASFLLGSLPSLPRSPGLVTPDLLGAFGGLVGYSLDTPRRTSV